MGTGTTRLLVGAGIAAAATLAVDQVTKAVTRSSMEPNETRDLALGGAIGIGHVRNYGSAYGLVGAMPAWIPAVGSLAIGGAFLGLGRGSRMPLVAGIGAGMVIGGGMGNVIDRVHQGHVTDMLHATDAFGYFNVADVAISAGLAAGAGVLLFAR